MERKHAFLLMTLLSCLLAWMLIPLFAVHAGIILGENISFISVYNSYWYTETHNIINISLAGVILLLEVFGSLLLGFFLLLSFIFFIIAGKKVKLSKLVFVLTGFTLVITIGVVCSLLILTSIQSWVDFAFYLVYTMSPIQYDYCYGYDCYYSWNATHYRLTTSINRCVRGGLYGLVLPSVMSTMLVPFVTFVLSIIFSKKKKVEQGK